MMIVEPIGLERMAPEIRPASRTVIELGTNRAVEADMIASQHLRAVWADPVSTGTIHDRRGGKVLFDCQAQLVELGCLKIARQIACERVEGRNLLFERRIDP